MKLQTYILYLEEVVRALLEERGHERDLSGKNIADGSPCTFGIYNIREQIQKQKEARDES